MRKFIALFCAMLSTAAVADGIDGIWDNKSERDKVKGDENSISFVQMIVLKEKNEIAFNYINDGHFRCEVPGFAIKAESGQEEVYVFENAPQFWRLEDWEGYREQESDRCKIKFTFKLDELKVNETASCNSFCGAGGAISATLNRRYDM